ncbi:ionotropic receptor 21a [Episyrphus balteatus]|uniref:ionotropic receptor 21a n=1 Tax=Episyrphus balteatus TaxID=286459 RepID=UPI0024866671|nr:ionotropic receptor 21a [Episyrphus balteatus]
MRSENCSSDYSFRLEVARRYKLNEVLIENNCNDHSIEKRRVDPKFHGHPRTRGDILADKFGIDTSVVERQTNSLIKLLSKISQEYLFKCPPVVYYDNDVENTESFMLQKLFKNFPITFYHGQISKKNEPVNSNFRSAMDNNCRSYILFLSDPMRTRKIIGAQIDSRVVIVSRSSQWKLKDFLSSKESSDIVNLLVIGESSVGDPQKERPYVLYTHQLYADGLGANTPVVLTSWIKGVLSRPHIDLFPKKMSNGFSGHRFSIAAVNQPPFIFRIRKLDAFGQSRVDWEGIEYRLMTMFAKQMNFSFDVVEPKDHGNLGSGDTIVEEVRLRKADLGMAGVFLSEERVQKVDISHGHSRDCAAFITLASKALPKYRAILGPFQWPVWLALTLIYLGGIVPIVFTDQLSLRHLIGNWGEMENMFWYVFGMFTNSFTFTGRYSWSNSKRASTRILIGFYWLFTIIITSCYTGSIIAFVTLPAFPATVDSVNDLLGLFFRVGTLDRGGWEKWFQNSTHESTAKLYKKMEFVATLEEGIGNVTQSFFWKYAFLGSKAQLEYLVQSNFSNDVLGRRSALHLSEECFAQFQIGFAFPKNSVYSERIDLAILLAQESGLISKISNEVSWVMQRSASGKLLQASSSKALRERIQEERQLTTADTEGMFLLMAIGYVLGALALASEIIGGFTNKCRQILKRTRKSVSSGFSSARSSFDFTNKKDFADHLRRKAVRHEMRDAAAENSDSKFFGFKEFNLTKATLKELYGSYKKPEPNFIFQNGRLILETDARSIESSLGTITTPSSAGECPQQQQHDVEEVVQHLDACIDMHDRQHQHVNNYGSVEIDETINEEVEDPFGSLVDDVNLVSRYENLKVLGDETN